MPQMLLPIFPNEIRLIKSLIGFVKKIIMPTILMVRCPYFILPKMIFIYAAGVSTPALHV